jgi:hypothetical protein
MVQFDGQGHFKGVFHHHAVEDRQYAGHAQAYGAGVGIRRRAERGGTSAEDFAFGQELGVDFQPDNGFVVHGILVFILWKPS